MLPEPAAEMAPTLQESGAEATAVAPHLSALEEAVNMSWVSLATPAALTTQSSSSSTAGAVLLEPAAEAAAVLPRCAEETAAPLPESGERTPINLRMTDEEIDAWSEDLEISEFKCRAKKRSAPHWKMPEEETIAS